LKYKMKIVSKRLGFDCTTPDY